MRLSELTAANLKKLFLFGVRLEDEDGNKLEDDVLDFYIASSIRQLEAYLGIYITPRTNITERIDYRQDIWRNFAFMQLRQRPIISVTSIAVKFGDATVFNAPSDWWRIENRMGQIHFFPTLGTFASVPMLGLSALSPVLLKTDTAPQVFEVVYSAGIAEDALDEDLAEAIFAFAALNIFNIMGDIVIGPGIAGLSMGLDGLSQSISTTASSEHSAYGARIELYQKRMFGARVGDPGLIHSLRAKWRTAGIVLL